MILHKGEILTVYAMYDADGEPTDNRSEAREFDVVREDCSLARLRLPHSETELSKVERH